MQLERFNQDASKVVAELKAKKPMEALIVHHDDADGLCSAAIMKKALERENIRAKTFCLEKLYEEVVEDLQSKTNQTIFYVDIGSSHADLISKCNKSKNLTIILDHHDPKPSSDPKVLDLNLENYGFKGETDFSGATCCYLFAKVMNNANQDLSYLALVGSSEIPAGFIGINRNVLDEAVKSGVVQQRGKSFEVPKMKIRVDAFFSKLQVLGAVGYYEYGPEIGISACLEGLSDAAEEKVNVLEARRKEANRQVLARLYRERLKETAHIQWFDAGNAYAGMGTKVIGQFCSFLAYQARLIKPNKYLVGFVDVPPEIPSWGKLEKEFVKASVRVPRAMQALIDEKKLLGAVNLLDRASEGFGLADGHQYAASIILPRDKKQTLIDNAEKQIG